MTTVEKGKRMQICPHCERENADQDAYCYACGHILPSALQGAPNATSKLEEVYESLEPKRRWGTAYFDRKSQIQMTVRGTNDSMVLDVSSEMVLGRMHSEDGVPIPDVDLTPYEAIEKGVSRVHAALTRDEDTVLVSDLSSANGTFLNGQRLMPHEPRILRDNDELRLGRLVIRVAFV
jgi:hypothetical protein